MQLIFTLSIKLVLATNVHVELYGNLTSFEDPGLLNC
jgi:hypothetical protein